MKVLILGIGSPFGDDRLGWEVVEGLRRSSRLAATAGGGISFVVLDRPGAMLLRHWRDADYVIVVDAVRSGAPPGTRYRLGPGEWTAHESVSSHGFGLASALELAHALNELPPHLTLYGMAIDPASAGTSLSDAVRLSLPALIRDIEREACACAQPGVSEIAHFP